ncbi:MAG: hypothetical protein HC888_00820 [Candidatus Competibacteraceae bacterium]|nr:hypothetical protein [Candidatus Competibacteraceae bacterium]
MPDYMGEISRMTGNRKAALAAPASAAKPPEENDDMDARMRKLALQFAGDTSKMHPSQLEIGGEILKNYYGDQMGGAFAAMPKKPDVLPMPKEIPVGNDPFPTVSKPEAKEISTMGPEFKKPDHVMTIGGPSGSRDVMFDQMGGNWSNRGDEAAESMAAGKQQQQLGSYQSPEDLLERMYGIPKQLAGLASPQARMNTFAAEMDLAKLANQKELAGLNLESEREGRAAQREFQASEGKLQRDLQKELATMTTDRASRDMMWRSTYEQNLRKTGDPVLAKKLTDASVNQSASGMADPTTGEVPATMQNPEQRAADYFSRLFAKDPQGNISGMGGRQQIESLMDQMAASGASDQEMQSLASQIMSGKIINPTQVRDELARVWAANALASDRMVVDPKTGAVKPTESASRGDKLRNPLAESMRPSGLGYGSSATGGNYGQRWMETAGQLLGDSSGHDQVKLPDGTIIDLPRPYRAGGYWSGGEARLTEKEISDLKTSKRRADQIEKLILQMTKGQKK